MGMQMNQWGNLSSEKNLLHGHLAIESMWKVSIDE